MQIPITPSLSIDSRELEITFILGSGPGGQNVNKVATAAQLRFDTRLSPSLPGDVKHRLQALAGARLTRDGVVVITARRFRSQDRNRADAVERLVALIREAADRPVPRRPTRPTRGSQERRLGEKAHRSAIKRDRGGLRED